MKKVFLYLIAAFVFLSYGISVSSHANKSAAIALSDAESEVLQETNIQRQKKNMGGVTPNPALMALARNYAKRLAENNVLTHELNGEDFSKRIKKSGYSYRLVGENLAAGQYSPSEVVKAWLGSKPHRHNLLNSKFTEIGIGVYKSKNGYIFYCQVFGTPL